MIRSRARLAAWLFVATPAARLLAGGAAAPYEIRDLTEGYRPDAEVSPATRSTADGDWTVTALREPGDTGWCWVVSLPRDGGAPVELSGPIWRQEFESPEFVLSPDGRRVAYLRRADAAAPRELWSRSVDGSAPAIRLRTAATPDERARTPRFTPDGQAVLFVHSRPGEPGHLRSVPATGGAGRLLDSGDLEWAGTFSPSGAHAVYWNEIVDGLELRAVALAGGAAWTLGGIVAPPFADETEPIVSPGGSHVVFSAGLDDPDAPQVWSVPLTLSGSRIRISAEHPAGSEVDHLEVTATGRAVYRRRLAGGASYQLWSAPVDGSAPALRVDGGLVAGGSVGSTAVAGAHVVFLADALVDEKHELWGVAADGSGSRTRRNAALTADRDVHAFEVAPDALRVVYRADGTVTDRNDLYSTTAAGVTAIRRLSNLEPFDPGYDAMAFDIASDSRTVVYSTAVDGQFDGRLVVQSLHAPTLSPARFETAPESVPFEPLDGGWAVRFSARREGDAREELYLADRRFFADGVDDGSTGAWSVAVP